MQYTTTQVKQALEELKEEDITEEYVVSLTNALNEALLSPKLQGKILTNLIEYVNNLSNIWKKGNIIWT